MSSSPTQVAGNAAPRVTNEEVRAVLHSHIRKTAKFIKFLDLCVHLFAWIAAMFSLWLIACIVDHWVVPLSSVGRWVVWIVAVIGTAWWIVRKLVPLIFRKINPAYAAKRIEHLLPEFKNGLISWFELDQMPENGVPRGIMSALTYRAARFIGGQDPSSTVDTGRLIKLIGFVFLLFTSLVVYTIVSPKSVLDTGKRIAMPWRSIAAPSRVKILSVKPGAVELTQGKPLEVDVEVRGIRANEAVRVRFTTTDGQLRDQHIDLTTINEGYHYGGKVRTETTGVEHELDYWVEAGDAISGPYRVSLSPLPSVVLDQVELKFPAYTKIPDRKVSGGDFEAIEGTRATIHALGNQKMSRGRLEINPEVDAAGELIRADAVHELSVDDRQLTGTHQLQLNSEKENPTKLTYRLRGFNLRGDGNREPILHSMKVIADVGPEIKLVGPESRRLNVRPTTKFNLEVQANDPDFGLSQIDIEIRRSGLVVRKETLLKSEGAIGQQIKRIPINMADFKFPEGTKLEVRATAYDNRHDPNSEKLAPNTKESELLTLEVVGPDQEAAADEEPAPQSDESASGTGKSEKNQAAGNESSGSGAGNSSNNQGADNRGGSPNDPNGAEPPPNNPDQKDGSQEPRQNSTPNPANPNGSPDQGEQQGAKGKEEGKQGKQESGEGKQGAQSKQSDGKSSDGKQKSGEAGGQQSGDGKQGAGQQQTKQQGGQSGTGNESSDGSQQPDSGSAGASKSSQANPSKAGQSGNEQSNSPSNSLGSKSNSPSSNAGKSNSGEKNNSSEKNSSGEKSSSGKGSDSEAGAPSGSDEGSKPSDGEVVKRVQEYMQENKPKPNADQNSSQSGNEQSGNEQSGKGDGKQSSGENSKPSSKPPSESNSNDPSGKPNSDSDKQKSQSTNKGSQENKPQDKDSDKDPGDQDKQSGTQQGSKFGGNESSDGSKQPDAGQSGNQKGSDGKGSEGQGSDGKGSDGKGSDGKGSDGKGSDGKGSDGKGSDGKGSDGKGSDGKGSDGKGSDGKGSDGKGSDGKGSDGKGSDGKGSDGKGSDGKGSDGKGSDGKGSDGKGSDGKGFDGKGSDGKGSDGKGSDGKGSDGKGADSKGSDGKGAESKGSESEGAESKGGAQAGQPTEGGGGGGKANGSKSGKSGSSGSGTGNGEGGGDAKADAANEDYANRTTQMVLDYLNRQKDQPDPELLRELNWTEDDLRKFTERWNRARNLAASPNPEDQKRWKEMLEDLGLNRQLVKPSAAGRIDDNFQQARDSGNRTRPPENLRKQYDAFRRAFEKSGK